MQQPIIDKEIKLYKGFNINIFKIFKSILSISIFMLVISISFIFYSKPSFAIFTVGEEITTKEWLKSDKYRDLKNSDFNNFAMTLLTPFEIQKNNSNFIIYRKGIVHNFDSGISSSNGVGISKNPFALERQRIDTKNLTIDDYYIGPWVYFPKLGKYLRYVAFVNGTFEEQTSENIKYKEQKLNFEKLLSTKTDGFQRDWTRQVLWLTNIGYNCYFNTNKKEQEIKCYNELDTSDYERYIYYGTSSKEERDAYIKFYNVKPLSSYFINKKYIKENKKSWILSENKKEKRKILIMVPKDQVKYFIKDIKTIPDNALKGLEGYVWFLSEPINRDITQMHKVNIKKYDVKPNDKYDAELSRISGGKLKAKYGRYLTKERYSEDYVAPSIYGNNYNDKPDW